MSYSNNPTAEEKENMKNFLLNLGKILPCQKCRSNFYGHLNKYPLNDYSLNNRVNFLNWLTAINNEVRQINGNKVLTPNEMINKYLSKDGNCDIWSNFLYISSLLLIVIILIMLVKFRY